VDQTKDQAERELSFSSIAASSQLKDQLARAVSGNDAPLLLVGQEGAGKDFIGRRLAAALLCQEPDPVTGACGRCPSCRLFTRGSHVDLIEVAPAEDKTSIPVADVRALVAATLPIYPQLSARKVYLIRAPKADSLNEAGQNALLKPMEEHPPFVRFILLTEEVDQLLPTIRSRSRMIRIGRRSQEEILQILAQAGFQGQGASLAANYADGLPGQALALAGDSDFRRLRDQVLDLLLEIPAASRTQCLTDYLNFFREEKKQIALILRLTESFLRDLLILQRQIPETRLINSDLEEALAKISRAPKAPDPAQAAEIVRQTGRALKANANFDHTVARMLLALRANLGGHREESAHYQARESFL